MSGQWPAFEVLPGQKGRQMAVFPLEDERFQGLVRARAVWALWPDGSPRLSFLLFPSCVPLSHPGITMESTQFRAGVQEP